jgi:hypothetical protein
LLEIDHTEGGVRQPEIGIWIDYGVSEWVEFGAIHFRSHACFCVYLTTSRDLEIAIQDDESLEMIEESVGISAIPAVVVFVVFAWVRLAELLGR